MPRDVNTFLRTQQVQSPPDLSQDWAIFEELYSKRLWHQLTLKLQDFVKLPALQQNDSLIQLYENFIADFENKINPLSLIEIISYISKQITDPQRCIEFITKTKEKVKGNTEATILCNILMGQIRLANKDADGIKQLMAEMEELIGTLDGVTAIHGRYYQLCSDYHQVTGQHAQYYRDALRYLGCTELGDIPVEEQMSRAFTLCLAALLGDGVYNFGELLSHPILDSLNKTDKMWVVELMHVFNSGNLGRYEELETQWKTQPDLEAHESALRQKITLLCLMEMTFKRPGNHRVLTFTEIATEAKLPESDVEVLVMQALSLGLVRGSIDQVDKRVHMRWVQPRVLDKNQIATMKMRLDQWSQDVQSMELLLEDKAKDILT